MKRHFVSLIILATASIAAAAGPADPPSLVEKVIEAVEEAFTPTPPTELEIEAAEYARRLADGCYWSGTGPFCMGYCGKGFREVKRNKFGDGGLRCWTGNKVLCCPKKPLNRKHITFPPVIPHSFLPPPKLPPAHHRKKKDEAEHLEDDEAPLDHPEEDALETVQLAALNPEDADSEKANTDGVDELDDDPEHFKDAEGMDDDYYDAYDYYPEDYAYGDKESGEDMEGHDDEKPRKWFSVRSEKDL